MKKLISAGAVDQFSVYFTCAQMKAKKSTLSATMGALPIQAWQLDPVGEDERQREAKKEKGEAEKSNYWREQQSKPDESLKDQQRSISTNRKE